MKTVILAGGYGTRISEESYLKPKPMIAIGDKPILWHIMKIYSHYGFTEFVICCGYKGYMIKKYFADYYLHNCDIFIDISDNRMTIHNRSVEPWKITLVNTGLDTMTGGRIKRVQPYIGNEPFMLTYGDGVSDENIAELIRFHKSHGKLATLTAVQPEGRFGILDLNDKNQVNAFREKRKDDMGWINAGFMVLEPQVFDYISSDDTVFEQETLVTLADQHQLMAYKYSGNWQCMDTQRDKRKLEALWASGDAFWKVWND